MLAMLNTMFLSPPMNSSLLHKMDCCQIVHRDNYSSLPPIPGPGPFNMESETGDIFPDNEYQVNDSTIVLSAKEPQPWDSA